MRRPPARYELVRSLCSEASCRSWLLAGLTNVASGSVGAGRLSRDRTTKRSTMSTAFGATQRRAFRAPKSRPKIFEKVARLETLKKHSALICQCSSTGSRPSRNTPSCDAARIDARRWCRWPVTLRSRIALERSRYSAVMDVLDHHHADEVFMLVMMVEGEFDQPFAAPRSGAGPRCRAVLRPRAPGDRRSPGR